jgi:iron complex transport system ATP-binding protein
LYFLLLKKGEIAVLEIMDLTVCLGGLTIVNNACFSVGENQWVMMIGPNGAGKSTVVGAIAQGTPYTGSIKYDGREIAGMKPAQIARRIGVLTQGHRVAYPFTVREIVWLGRYSYSAGIFGSASDDDARHVREALEITGMLPFENQSALTLSGGELQRAFLAQVFAQDPQLLILDEPANHLDLVYQKQMFEAISGWLRKPGRAVLSVVHDLGLARAYGTHAVLLNRGVVEAWGPLEEVVTGERLRAAYDMDVCGWMREMLSLWGG